MQYRPFARWFLIAVCVAGCTSPKNAEQLGITDAPTGGNDSPASLVCAAVENATASATSSTAITLSWPGAAGISYMIQRKTYCGTDDYVDLGTVTSGTTYTDDSVQPSYVYWYLVTATDGSNATASVAVAAQAATNSAPACASGTMPQDGGATNSCTATASDAGAPVGSGSNPGTDTPPVGCGGPTIHLDPSMNESTIQSMITSAPRCSLIEFAAGTYHTTKSIQLACNDLTLTGPAVHPQTAIISTSTPTQNIFSLAPCTAGVKLEFLQTLGAGLLYVGPGTSSDISILHNSSGALPSEANGYTYSSSGAIFFEGSGIPVNTSVTNVDIEFNAFGDDSSCTAVYSVTPTLDNGYCAGVLVGPNQTANWTIKYNKFYHLEEGLHFEQAGYNAANNGKTVAATDNLDVEDNYFLGIHRIAAEIQVGVINHPFVVANNIFQDYHDAYFGTLGLSTPCCQNTNVQGTTSNVAAAMIQNNNLHIQSIPGSPPYAIEFWGNGSQGNHSLIQGGFGNGYTWGFGSGNWQVLNNIMCGSNMQSAGTFISNEEHTTNPPTQTGNQTSATCSSITSTAPTITPSSGKLSGSPITLSDTGNTGVGPNGNTVVYYTIDGSTPVPGQGTTQLYTGPITLTAPATVKAVGLYGSGAPGAYPQTWPDTYPTGFGYTPSAVVTATYTR